MPEWFSERLRSEFPQLEVVHLPNYDRVTEEIADADIAISWSLRGEQIKAAKKLRWIHSTAAAVHQLMTPELSAATMTIVGMGGIGRPLARLAKSLGMRVVGVREHPERGSEVADVTYGF